MRQGFQGLEDLTAIFKKTYGLEQLPPNTRAYQRAWKKATADCRKSFKETFEQLGWVTEEEYHALWEENQKLRHELKERNHTIQSLKLLLEEKGLDQTQNLDVFKNLIHQQGKEFQKLMKSLSEPAPSDK